MEIYSLDSTYGLMVWVFSGIFLFFLLEYIIPFRPSTLSKLNRWRINFSVNLCNVVLIDYGFIVLLHKTEFFSSPLNFDLLNTYNIPSLWRMIITVVILDFSMYAWHRLNHAIPFLWRFHRVHHTDLNLDVSTASRFHFGEVTGSTVITYSFMLMLGATIFEVRVFQVILFLMAQFGHSNLKLWKPLDEFLWFILVPPAMHRIHHSQIKEEADSNFGTIFSFWDRIFRTFKKDVEQSRLVFGLKEFNDPKELFLFKILLLPFRGFFSKVDRSQNNNRPRK